MLIKTSRTRRAAARARANDNDSLIPELWANESLAILEENMIIGNLVYRDYSPMVAKFGDTVNTRKPNEFLAHRKVNADTVTIQDATSTNIPVRLDQWSHTSFMIMDGEESLAFKDLVNEYLKPAMLAQARFVDQCLYGRMGHFLPYCAGGLGSMTTSNGRQYILDTRNKMNINKADVDGRSLLLSPNSETTLLNMDLFTQAQMVGDGGTALQNATLGKKLGFNMYMAQNTPSVPLANATYLAGAINSATGYPAGTTSFTVDGLSAAIVANTWITIAGDMTPLRVVSTTGGATPTAIVTDRAIRTAVADNAVVTVYKPAAVNFGAGYAAGYAKAITVAYTGSIAQPAVGQLVSFGTGNPTAATTPVYMVAQVPSATTIVLDRPLDYAIADTDKVHYGPQGDYNFAFTKNAISLVSRPLATPRAGTGALSAAVNYNNIGMRATITYNGEKQGHLITLDLLFGTALLEVKDGAILLA